MKSTLRNVKLVFSLILLFFVIGCAKEKTVDLNNINNSTKIKEIDKRSVPGEVTAGCTIYGYVKEKGTLTPLAGADCIRVSNSVGTSTTITGGFSITVPVGVNDALDFSYLGYKTVRVAFISGALNINMGTIELEPVDEE